MTSIYLTARIIGLGLGSEVMQKFKLATNGPSCKRFLLISKLCVQGLSVPVLGLYTCDSYMPGVHFSLFILPDTLICLHIHIEVAIVLTSYQLLESR